MKPAPGNRATLYTAKIAVGSGHDRNQRPSLVVRERGTLASDAFKQTTPAATAHLACCRSFSSATLSWRMSSCSSSAMLASARVAATAEAEEAGKTLHQEEAQPNARTSRRASQNCTQPTDGHHHCQAKAKQHALRSNEQAHSAHLLFRNLVERSSRRVRALASRVVARLDDSGENSTTSDLAPRQSTHAGYPLNDDR